MWKLAKAIDHSFSLHKRWWLNIYQHITWIDFKKQYLFLKASFRRGGNEELLNWYQVSIMQDECVLEIHTAQHSQRYSVMHSKICKEGKSHTEFYTNKGTQGNFGGDG